MNSYVDRTRPALGFVDIGIALPDCRDATVHKILGTPTAFDAYNRLTHHATHRMRSARSAFDLLEVVNREFQARFPVREFQARFPVIGVTFEQ